MARFRVYSTLAYQIEPEVTDPEQQDDLRSLINNSVDCYVDLSVPRILCMFEADSSRVSRSRQGFLAEYVADDRSELFSGVVREIRALEGDGSEADWTLFDDGEASNVVWEFDAAGPRSLGDLGADLSLKLVLEELLEEGVKLDLGITGNREAAVAVTHLARETDSDAAVAISSNGRTPALDDTGLVLKPGTGANFDPLDDRTKTTIESRLQDQKSRIRNWYESTMREELDALVDGELEVWPRYAELQRLETALGDDGIGRSDHGLRTEQATRLRTLVRSLVRNEQPADEQVDPKVLDNPIREDLTATARQWVADERRAIEEHAAERTVTVLQEDITALRELDRPIEQDALRRLLAVLDKGVSSDQAFDHPAAQSFADHVAMFERSDALSAKEKEEVENELRRRLEDRLDEVVANERFDLLERFERWLDDDEGLNRIEQSKRLKRAKRLLDRGERDSDWVSAGKRGDGGWGAVDDRGNGVSVPVFERLLSDIESNPVLPPEKKTEVRSTVGDRLDEEIDQHRADAEELYREKLSSHVAAIHDDEASIEQRYRRLEDLKRVRSTDTRSGERSREVGSFLRDVESLREHPLLDDDDARAIVVDVDAEIETRQAALYDRKRKRIRGGFRRELEEALDDLDSATHAQLDDELERVEGYLTGRVEARDYPDRPALQEAKRYLDELGVRRSQEETILDRPDRESLHAELQDQLSAAREELRHGKLDELKGELEDRLAAFREASFATENQLAVLDWLLAYPYRGDAPKIDLPGGYDRRDGIQERTERLTELLGDDLAVDGASLLEGAERSELATYYENRLEEVRTALSADLLESLEGTVKQRYDEAIVVDSESASIDAVNEAIDRLESRRSEIRTLCNGSITGSDYLDQQTIERVGMLDSDHGEALRTELLRYVDEEAERLKARRAELVRDSYLDAIQSVVDAEAPPSDRLVALSGIREILKVGHAERLPIVDERRLVENRNEIGKEERETISDRLDATEPELFDQYRLHVERTVRGGFRAHFERDSRTTAVTVDSYLQLLDGGEYDERLLDSEYLDPPVDCIDELRRMKSYLTTGQYQELSGAIRGAAKRYDDGEAGSGSSVPARLPGVDGSVGNRLAGFTKFVPSWQVAVVALACFLLGLIAGVAIVALGLFEYVPPGLV